MTKKKSKISQKIRNTFYSLVTAFAVFSYASAYTYSYNPHNLSNYDSTRVAAVLTKIRAISSPSDIKLITVTIVDDNSYNASASQPEGPTSALIIVNKGALAMLHNEDELAFVLAHEWSHVLLGHTRIAGVYEENSIKSEMYADLLGQQLVRLAGYDPGYGADTWKRLIISVGDIGGNTHPKCSERQHYLTVTKHPLNIVFDILYNTGETITKYVNNDSSKI